MSASERNEQANTVALAVTVFVCTSCGRASGAGGIERPGAELVDELAARFATAGAPDITVSGV
jgi:hypothetical protein